MLTVCACTKGAVLAPDCTQRLDSLGVPEVVSACVDFQAASQQADSVMAPEQAAEPQPSSPTPAQEMPAQPVSQDAQAAPAEETPESRAAALLEADAKQQRERRAAPAAKPEDLSALLPG